MKSTLEKSPPSTKGAESLDPNAAFHALAIKGRPFALVLTIVGAAACIAIYGVVMAGYEFTKLKALCLGPMTLTFGLASLIEPRLLTKCWDPNDHTLNRFHAISLAVFVFGGLLAVAAYVLMVEG